MQRTRRFQVSVLAAVLLVCVFAPASLAESVDTYYPKYDPPITLTAHATISVNEPFHEGDSPEHNGFTRWCEDVLGIKWELQWTTSDGTTNSQKLDLAFASDDLPDVINPSILQLSKYQASGKIVPLNDLIEKYASPVTKWVIEDAVEQTNGALFKPFTFNGDVYMMPSLTDTLAFWQVNFIRTDILDELGASAPSTIAETEALFDKYLEKHPENYPLVISNNLMSTTNGLRTVMSAYNAYMDMWAPDAEGNLQYTSIQPEMRDALAKAAEWYHKGYINPEFAVMDDAKINETVAAGEFLLYHGQWSAIGNPFGNMWINNPDSVVAAMPYLTDGEGTGKIMKSSWFTGGCAITTACENPEALFYLFNLQLESCFRNEGLMQEAAAKAGYTMHYPYTEIREPLNKEEIAKNFPTVAETKYLWIYDYPQELVGPKFFNDFYTDYGEYGFVAKPVSIGNNGYASLTEAVRTGDMSLLTATAQEAYNGWYASNPKMLTTFVTIYDYCSKLPFEVNGFAGANTPTMTEKKSYLDKLQVEAFSKIIMNSEPIEAFDKFVEAWKANGGDQITDEVNAWYKGQ